MPSNDSSHEPELFRELVHEPEYVDALEKIFKDIRRADDVMEGLETFVSRRAEMGMAYERYPADFATWLSKRTPQGRVRVLYKYNDRSVHLLLAWIIPDWKEGQFLGR
ncbi:MAG TPA: hypothetical protein VLE27_04995 [Thermoanaerobaculia bacterium]|nr:hypothetical protein [Thermoanaerobaculia bacterium]